LVALKQQTAEREGLCMILVTIFASGIVAGFDDATAPEILECAANSLWLRRHQPVTLDHIKTIKGVK
jgi:hypothetical protein